MGSNSEEQFQRTLQAATDLCRAHDYVGAHHQWQQLLQQVQAGQFKLQPEQQRHMARQLSALAPFWWQELVAHGGVTLRRCTASDADFFQSCYANPDFSHNYQRGPGWRGRLPQALLRYGQEPPLVLGMLQWVICLHGQSVGLASLSHLDPANRKAEFSIGILGSPPPGIALKATLLAMHFSYFVAGFNKIYTYVYEDNVKGLHNTERLGFVKEGFLHEHFRLREHFVSVHFFGLTKQQLQSNSRLLRLSKKYTTTN